MSMLNALSAAAGALGLSAMSSLPQSGFRPSNAYEGGRYVGHIIDRSRYQPHQGKRESARRRHQMERLRNG